MTPCPAQANALYRSSSATVVLRSPPVQVKCLRVSEDCAVHLIRESNPRTSHNSYSRTIIQDGESSPEASTFFAKTTTDKTFADFRRISSNREIEMPHPTGQTWLQKLDEQLNVDVDWMDPTYSKNLQITPNDQTSNNLWVNQQMSHPDNEEMFMQVCKELKSDGWKAAYTRIAVLMCKENIGNIKGRVLLQVYPNEAYDHQAVLDSARAYAREFERAGIPQDRYCIKIPSVGPALSACPKLKEEGIATLGTALFSLAQAIAASQAGCLYISPYFNEVKAHDDLKLWPDVEDPATQHTMSARTMQILETYARLYKETGREQPLLKQASFITAKEAMAAGEHGCHSATISPQVLDELASLQYDGTKQPGEGRPKQAHVYAGYKTPERLAKVSRIDPLVAAGIDAKLASTDIDYLAEDGAALDEANQVDPVTAQRLKDALELFTGGLLESKAKIEKAFAEV